jgi:hypothetical protein
MISHLHPKEQAKAVRNFSHACKAMAQAKNASTQAVAPVLAADVCKVLAGLVGEQFGHHREAGSLGFHLVVEAGFDQGRFDLESHFEHAAPGWRCACDRASRIRNHLQERFDALFAEAADSPEQKALVENCGMQALQVAGVRGLFLRQFAPERSELGIDGGKRQVKIPKSLFHLNEPGQGAALSLNNPVPIDFANGICVHGRHFQKYKLNFPRHLLF